MSIILNVVNHNSGIFKTGVYISTDSDDGLYMDTIYNQTTGEWFQIISPCMDTLYSMIDEVNINRGVSTLLAIYYKVYFKDKENTSSVFVINQATGKKFLYLNKGKTLKYLIVNTPIVVDIDDGVNVINNEIIRDADTCELLSKIYLEDTDVTIRLEFISNNGYLKHDNEGIPYINPKPKARLSLVQV